MVVPKASETPVPAKLRVFSDSGLNFDGDVVDFVVFRGVIKDSSSVPSNVEAQTLISDVISGTERELKSEGRALGLVV